MKVAETIGKNIRIQMDKKGLSQRSMAEIIGVTHPTLGKYLSGEQIIDSVKLSRIASYFNLPFDYFFRDEHKELNLLFRADKPAENLEDLDLHAIRRKLENYIDVVSLDRLKFIPQTYSLQPEGKKLTEEDLKSIEKVAHDMRKALNIEHVIPDNYYAVLEDSGVNVLALPYANVSLFGFSSLSAEYGSFVFVNSHESISEERQLFSLFHELGHLLFNRNEYKASGSNPFYKCSQSDLNEKIVNKFSQYFLLPRGLVDDYIASRNKDINVMEMKRHFGVSLLSLYMALHDYGHINAQQSQNFWKKASSNGWRVQEPSPLPHGTLEDKNGRLFASLKKLYLADEISVNRISEVLDIELGEARKMVKGWGVLFEQYEKL